VKRAWAIAMLTWAVSVPARAQVTNQDTGAVFPTIQAAIDAAGFNETLVLDPGVYNEALVVNQVVTIEGAGVATITASSGYGVIDIPPTLGLTLRGVTLSSATVRAINAQAGSGFALEDVVITGTTTTGHGGGIYAPDTSGITILDVTFQGTSATLDGGAIYVASDT